MHAFYAVARDPAAGFEIFCTRDPEVKYPDVYRCNHTHTDSAHSYNSYRYYIEIEVFLSTDYLAITIQSRIKKADVGRGKKDKSSQCEFFFASDELN